MENPQTNHYPFITIVMPIRNEAAFIRQGLSAVLSQDYPAERMEIIVADGMSTDGTFEIVQALQAKYANLHVIRNQGKIVPTGMNAALMQARGEIIIRVDGHCEIAPDYARRCIEHLQNDGVDGVGGPLETIGETGMACTIALAMSSPFGVGGSAFRTVKNKSMLVDTVAFPAYTRTIMERAGPYDEELVRNQDDEYNYRLRKLGAKILLAANIHARYYSRSSLRSLWRQYFQYGYWKVRVLQKHPRQMRPRQFAPIAFVVAFLGTSVLAFFTPIGRVLLFLVAGSYSLTSVASSVWTARKHGWSHLFLLPVVYLMLHLSYGLGFLCGLVKFRNRWRDTQTHASTRHDIAIVTNAASFQH